MSSTSAVKTWVLLCFAFLVLAGGHAPNAANVSLTPPRGWNSYDSFSWIISEEQFLRNAEYMAANLHKFGYEYVVVDYLWYRRQEKGATYLTPGYDIVDEWGRPVPDPVRWPSSAGGKGFKPVADKVHAMGLKFGIHVMRGISTAAVQANSPILCSEDCEGGRSWTAQEIVASDGRCAWMPKCFSKVDLSLEGGRAFIDSLYRQYAEWEVDLIKHDCVFGVDLALEEITAVSKAIERTGRPMVYSLSPGVQATPNLGKQVAHLAHMYRVTGDDWDSWFDVRSHFAVARDFAAAGLIGAPGLFGAKSWPDMDMLPVGWLTEPGANHGPDRVTILTHNEQRTQITLWAMVKSPLMFGGDMLHMDPWTLNLITQPTILEINAHSTGNTELGSSEPAMPAAVVVEECRSVDTTQEGWTIETSEDGDFQLCWAHFRRRIRSIKGEQSVLKAECWRWIDLPQSLPQLDTEMTNSSGRTGQLTSTESGALCLESAAIDAEGGVGFTPCQSRASQVWHWQPEGKLVSGADNATCAVFQLSLIEWKIWVARGSEGQTYLALFNLGSERTTISVAVEDVAEDASFVPRENLADHSSTVPAVGPRVRCRRLEGLAAGEKQQTTVSPPQVMCKTPGEDGLLKEGQSSGGEWNCTVLDVWNNQTFSKVLTTLEFPVESHGTVLLELKCSPA